MSIERLIDANALKAYLYDEYHGAISDSELKIYEVIRLIENAPTVEKRGEWMNILRHPEKAVYVWECSVCGVAHDFGLLNYCPNCGAKMGGII